MIDKTKIMTSEKMTAEEKEAIIFASIWNRNRIIITSENSDDSVQLLNDVRFYSPAYRQYIICGDFPKGERYKKGVKLIETKESSALRVAFKQSLEEEELGAPPVQIIFFNANPPEFQNIFSYLDRGWILTSNCTRIDIEKSFRIYQEFEYQNGRIYILDPIPENTFVEKDILGKTRFSGKSIKEYLVQMKASQVHLSFKAITDELESGKQLTQSSLSEALNIREKTIKKVIEIGKREKRLDLQSYIEETPPYLVTFLKKMSMFRDLSLIAIFDSDQLMGYARYRDYSPSSQNFLLLKDEVVSLMEGNSNPEKTWFFEISGKNKNLLIYFHKYLFCFILEKGLKLNVFREKIEGHIKALETETKVN